MKWGSDLSAQDLPMPYSKPPKLAYAMVSFGNRGQLGKTLPYLSRTSQRIDQDMVGTDVGAGIEEWGSQEIDLECINYAGG